MKALSPVQTHLKWWYQGQSVPRVWQCIYPDCCNKIQRSLSQVCCHPELLPAAAVYLLFFLLICLHICGANNVLTTRWHHPDVTDICLLQPSKSNLHHCSSSCCFSSNKESKCINTVSFMKNWSLTDLRFRSCGSFHLFDWTVWLEY